MVRYRQEMGCAGDEKAAIEAMVRCEIAPITTATVTLLPALPCSRLSSFRPVAYSGCSAHSRWPYAYLANFLLTPILLSYTGILTLWELLTTPLRRELVRTARCFVGCGLPDQARGADRPGPMGRGRASGDGPREHSREMFVLLDGQYRLETERTDGSVARSILLTEASSAWPPWSAVASGSPPPLPAPDERSVS